MYLLIKTFHIFTFIFFKISRMAATLQHLQTSHPDAAYVQRLPLQEITQMNKKKHFNYFKSNMHNASYDNGVGSSFNIL